MSTCFTCRFRGPTIDDPNFSLIAVCRVDSPKISRDIGKTAEGWLGEWPMVKLSATCGRFEPKVPVTSGVKVLSVAEKGAK